MAKRKGSETQPVGDLGGKPARARRKELSDGWRKAMRGDERALESLLPLALEHDRTSTEGSAARRMVSRAYMHHARTLMSRAETAAATESDELRRQAQGYFYKAVLARHLELPKPADPCARSGQFAAPETPPATPVAYNSLFDPPPGPPLDVIAGALGLLNPTSAKVLWSPPESDGNKTITKYSITAKSGLVGSEKEEPGTARETTFTSLITGTNYTFTVKAHNADGKGPESLPSNLVTVGLNPPAAPSGVRASQSGATAVVEWNSASGISSYAATAYDPATTPPRAVRKKSLSGTSTRAVFSDLPTGNYRFGVRAFNQAGFGPEAQSADLAYTSTPEAFQPKGLPPFPAGSLLFFDVNEQVINPLQVQRLMTGALAQANKWRFEYLKAQAVKAAQDTLQYEQHIAQLMQMALTKVSTAELLLSPVLQDTIDEIRDSAQEVKGLGTSDHVAEAIKKVGDTAANALALEALILFLIQDPDIDFWIGLFGGMIDDVAHFDTGLNSTRGFLEEYLGKSSVGTQILQTIAQLRERIDEEVDAMAEPLKAAVADIIRGTTAGIEEVYRNFDNALLASTTTGGAVVLNPPPQSVPGLGAVLDNLQKTLDDLIARIKDLLQSLIPLNPTGLVIDLIIIFICAPILAALVISFIAGPIGAAILAAIVVIAAVELIRLVLRLLTGPLLGVLNDAKQAVLDALHQLQGIFERTANLLDNPKEKLFLVASHLLELKSLLPEAFLSDAAALLGEARRTLMANTTELALAAERALGMENATAFDVISTAYNTGLTPAPQMPGGTDTTLLAGAALLRDLNVLERQRIRVIDGKEVLVTQRLSLFRLLGGVGDPAAAAATSIFTSLFLKNGKMLLHLDEATLLDQGYPGLYRALISEVRPIGVFGSAPGAAALPISIPLSITHTGPSRTRVKRSANPEAPPVTVPDCLKLDAAGFVKHILEDSRLKLTAPQTSTLELSIAQLVDRIRDRAVATLQLQEPKKVYFYRAWREKDNDHFYTTDIEEHNKALNEYGYVHETHEGYVYPVGPGGPPPGTVPLFRLYHEISATEGHHFYTTSATERDNAIRNLGFVFEKFACYVYPAQAPGTVPLFRLYNSALKDHFYTVSAAGRDEAVSKYGYTDEGVACWVYPDQTPSATPRGRTFKEQVRLAFIAGIADPGVPSAYLPGLPDAAASFVGTFGCGLVDAAAVAARVRQAVEALFAGPFPECVLTPEGALQSCPSPADVKKAINDLQIAQKVKADAALVKTLRDGHAAGLSYYGARIAKWGGASFEEDRDPQIRALGFVTLVQSFPPESTVFDLLPDTATLSGKPSAAPHLPDAQSPVSSASTLQYRPFENRGLGCDLLLSLGAPVAPGTLIDLLLEITVRACFDEDLAAAVRASRAQSQVQLERAKEVAASKNKMLQMPSTLSIKGDAASSLRTFNISLRAHRDNLLVAAYAAAEALELTKGKAARVDELDFHFGNDAPLKPGEALRGLTGTDLGKITLQFQHQVDKPTLGVLAGVIPLTPETFNTALDEVTSVSGELVGVGLAVIPMPPAGIVTPEDARKVDLSKPENRNQIAMSSVEMDPLIKRLLPQLATPTAETLKTRLTMTTAPPAEPVTWKQLWDQAVRPNPDERPHLTIDFADAIKKQQVYDVTFSLSFRNPVPATTVGPSAI